jgi:hypothetical protein
VCRCSFVARTASNWISVAPTAAMMSRRPKGKIQSIILHNTHNAEGEWIPTKFDLGSWVTLNPGTSGVWARDAKLHGGPTLRGAYKGQIIDWRFKVANVGRDVTNNPRPDSILTRWAYAPRQTRLDPEQVVVRPKCNCKCCSFHAVTVLGFYMSCIE